MRLEEAINQVEQKLDSNLKKRFACAHCGKTWAEIVGFFSFDVENQEEVYFRLGDQPEVCQNCKFGVRTCPACGSSDAYEINFPPVPQESPLSFNRIRIVSKT
jgi:transcription elongation factor Elf1